MNSGWYFRAGTRVDLGALPIVLGPDENLRYELVSESRL